ncbi:MAG: hypothetical protein IT372_02600 [Polyangiaceae bacterium]|nr:hypothetical protein [Polyangiaceae bacterium]
MDTDLLITLSGLAVAGLAAIVGIWVERDHSKPARYAYTLSGLIGLATIVGMYQCYSDAAEGEKMEADMARMLQMLDKIAASSEVEIPELENFVKTEINAQSRANPDVVAKLAQRVADEGGDPKAMLSQHLPPSEVEGLDRKGGLSVKPPSGKPAVSLAAAPAGDGSAAAPGDGPRPMMNRRGKRPVLGAGGILLGGPAAPAAVAAPAATAAPDAAATAAPATSADVKIADPSSLLPKGALGLGGSKGGDDAAKSDGTAKPSLVGPKPAGDAAKPDAPKKTLPAGKPKL